MPADDQLCDVCVVCAMAEEAQAVLRVFEHRCHVQFERATSGSRREYRVATIHNNTGEALKVHVSWPPKYGPTEMALHLKDVLREFRPRLAVMTGICAGDKSKVALGDLIVADRAFASDSGKFVLADSGRVHEHDTDTQPTDPDTLHAHQAFLEWADAVAEIARPPSKRQQREWLLARLLAPGTDRVDDIASQELAEHAPRGKEIIAELQRGPEPYLTIKRSLVNRQRIEEMRHAPAGFPYQDKQRPDRHIKALASGNAVRSDNPFAEIQAPVRTAWAVDMEGAAFYRTVADFPGTRSFVVKSVSDYADPDKDDSYHQYASEVSAAYALAFIQRYLTHQGIPRLEAQPLPSRPGAGTIGKRLRWCGLLISVAGLVVAATIWLLRREPSLGLRWTAVGVGSLLWLASLSCVLRSVTAVRPLPQGGRWRDRLALLGLVAIPLGGGAAGLLLPDAPALLSTDDPTKLRILVATFDGPDQEYGVTEGIVDQLRDAMKEFADVEVRALGQPITALQGTPHARQCGQEQRAAIVLWGWYRKTTQKARIEVRFEVLRRPEHFTLNEEKRSLILDAAELETFAVQQRLSGEVNCIVFLAAGLARYEAGDYDGAITRLTRAIDRHAVPEEMVNSALLYLLRGNAYSRKNDPDRAITDFDRVIGNLEPAGELQDGIVNAYLGRGIARHRKRDYDGALADFDRTLVVKPSSAPARNNRGVVFIAKQDHPQALAALADAIETDPAWFGPRLNRGGLYGQLRQFDKAAADFRRVLELDPSEAEAHYGLGFVYLELNDYDRALVEFNHALQLRPKFTRALYSRGNTYRAQGQLELSIADQSRAIQLDPHFMSAYLHRGIAYLQQQKISLALEDLDAAEALDPDSLEVVLNRGIAYARLEQYDRAIGYYNQVLAKKPDFAPALFNRAIAHDKQGQPDQALDDYSAALKIRPDWPEALNNRGNLMADKGQADQALVDFNRALEIRPGYAVTLLARGRFFVTQKKHDLAIGDFSRLIELHPSTPDGYYLRGQVHERKGDLGSARADYRKALERVKNEHSRMQIKEQLARLPSE